MDNAQLQNKLTIIVDSMCVDLPTIAPERISQRIVALHSYFCLQYGKLLELTWDAQESLMGWHFDSIAIQMTCVDIEAGTYCKTERLIVPQGSGL